MNNIQPIKDTADLAPDLENYDEYEVVYLYKAFKGEPSKAGKFVSKAMNRLRGLSAQGVRLYQEILLYKQRSEFNWGLAGMEVHLKGNELKLAIKSLEDTGIVYREGSRVYLGNAEVPALLVKHNFDVYQKSFQGD